MLLQDRVAFITGASSGIGKASAWRLAQAGARIAVVGRTPSEVERTAEELKIAGHEALAVVADVARADQLQAAVDQVGAAWDRIDVVFANAGINGRWTSLEDMTPEDWDQIMDINLKGTFLTVKYALPYLKRQGGSIIINSSVNGSRIFSNTGASAYASSKAGQVAFTKMIAVELARYKIRANVICPGAIYSEIGDNTSIDREELDKIRVRVDFVDGRIPLTGGKPGTSEQVADVVLFLASAMSSHVTGTEMWIDGGESLIQG